MRARTWSAWRFPTGRSPTSPVSVGVAGAAWPTGGGAAGREESRQVFDIPEKLALEVIEHLAKRWRCAHCGRVNEGHFAEDVVAPAEYGCNFRAFEVYVTVFHHIPDDRAHKLICDLAKQSAIS